MTGTAAAPELARLDGLRCPMCRTALAPVGDVLRCAVCPRDYPVYLDIPDLRGDDGTAAAWPVERALVPRMLEAYPREDVRGLLEVMLQGLGDRTDAQRAQLREYFVTGLTERARHRARVVELMVASAHPAPDLSRPLEIGCGAGAMLFELARRAPAIGIDPNLLHLIIARKHAEELGLPVQLICGAAERLPLPPGSRTFVHFMHTLEHFSDQRRGLASIAEVLAPGGIACFDVPNRFSLWREPHTRQWGLGFLPRKWTALDRIRNLSRRELTRMVAEAFGSEFAVRTMLVRFEVPGYAASDAVHLVAALLKLAERVPVVRTLVTELQPGFEVVAWRPPAGARAAAS